MSITENTQDTEDNNPLIITAWHCEKCGEIPHVCGCRSGHKNWKKIKLIRFDDVKEKILQMIYDHHQAEPHTIEGLVKLTKSLGCHRCMDLLDLLKKLEGGE